jgi:hypothetical protein
MALALPPDVPQQQPGQQVLISPESKNTAHYAVVPRHTQNIQLQFWGTVNTDITPKILPNCT